MNYGLMVERWVLRAYRSMVGYLICNQVIWVQLPVGPFNMRGWWIGKHAGLRAVNCLSISGLLIERNPVPQGGKAGSIPAPRILYSRR